MTICDAKTSFSLFQFIFNRTQKRLLDRSKSCEYGSHQAPSFAPEAGILPRSGDIYTDITGITHKVDCNTSDFTIKACQVPRSPLLWVRHADWVEIDRLTCL